jgi:hypothetical protein
MDRAQRRASRQLTRAPDGSQTSNGGRRRLGQQDGTHHLGDDDPPRKLPLGVSGAANRQRYRERLGLRPRQGDRLIIMRQGLQCSRCGKPIPGPERHKLAEPMWTASFELHTGPWR